MTPTKERKSHGGSLSRGKRKTRRPLNMKKSHHVVLRAEQAHGVRALIRHSSSSPAL